MDIVDYVLIAGGKQYGLVVPIITLRGYLFLYLDSIIPIAPTDNIDATSS